MAKIMTPTKVITGPNTLWSFCNVWEPKAINGGNPKYSVSLLIPKSERFERFSAPFIEKIMPARQVPAPPDLLEFESLEPGARGEEVLALQRYLKEAGYLRGAVDGDYGRGTQAAVSAFQKANGLEATGHADKETIQTINRLAAEAAREAEQQNKE